MTDFEKIGDFVIFVDGEYLMRVHCSHGEVLDLTWSIHHDKPTASIEIRTVGAVDPFFDDGE